MSPSLSELLTLPAGERAELAMVLWDSLSEAEREGELELTPEEGEELDRRWSDHVQRPDSSILWAEVRRKLLPKRSKRETGRRSAAGAWRRVPRGAGRDHRTPCRQPDAVSTRARRNAA